MRIPYFRVSAFTKSPFGGNPAGVCPLEKWLADDVMQKIAAENGLSETAFFLRDGGKMRLRWMTPAVEVDLCGHATLATAAVLFFELGYEADRIEFETRSGIVAAVRRGELVELDFPVWKLKSCDLPSGLAEALGATPKEIFYCERDYLAVFESEQQVRGLAPNIDGLMKLDRDGVIATARGSNPSMDRETDFVSRYFGPKLGIPEDPVTGSAHCALIPFWAERLGKDTMFARQISKRGGELSCRIEGQRVKIGGNATVYQRGEILV